MGRGQAGRSQVGPPGQCLVQVRPGSTGSLQGVEKATQKTYGLVGGMATVPLTALEGLCGLK